MKKYITLTAALLLVGCTTFYNSVISVTEIRKNVLTDLGVMYRQGLISQATDLKIEKADQEFIRAASVLELSLIAYKQGQSVTNKAEMLSAVKKPVYELVNILATFSIEAANKNKSNLDKASQL